MWCSYDRTQGAGCDRRGCCRSPVAAREPPTRRAVPGRLSAADPGGGRGARPTCFHNNGSASLCVGASTGHLCLLCRDASGYLNGCSVSAAIVRDFLALAIIFVCSLPFALGTTPTAAFLTPFSPYISRCKYPSLSLFCFNSRTVRKSLVIQEETLASDCAVEVKWRDE